MSFKDQDKIALSDDTMEQVMGGFSLSYLVGGSGSGAAARTMESRVIAGGSAITATTLQGGATAGITGGMRACTYCHIPLVNGACPKCGWPLLKPTGGTVEL